MSENNIVMHAKDMQKVSILQKGMKLLVLAGTYLFLSVMALIVLFPFYWMVISSLKDLPEYKETIPTFWPRLTAVN